MVMWPACMRTASLIILVYMPWPMAIKKMAKLRPKPMDNTVMRVRRRLRQTLRQAKRAIMFTPLPFTPG